MKQHSNILVVGSTNIDMVVKTERFPLPCETVLGGSFYMNLGGKGANQAVAAARLGADVCFITSLGNDIFGQDALQQLGKENMDLSAVQIYPNSNTGVALITVDSKAENNIVVASGSNALLQFDDQEELKKYIHANTIVLMQLEISISTIMDVATYAKSVGTTVVLNPAPAQNLPVELLKMIDIITPNEKEAEKLSGVRVHNVASALEAGSVIQSFGPSKVLVTMGAKGVFCLDGQTSFFEDAHSVVAVDTTAAGDVFNGALTVGLAQQKSLIDAVRFANKAAAIAVTKFGAQASAPTIIEMDNYFRK